jgi:hypothetical protein
MRLAAAAALLMESTALLPDTPLLPKAERLRLIEFFRKALNLLR